MFHFISHQSDNVFQIMLRTGAISLYEAFSRTPVHDTEDRLQTLCARFVKVHTRTTSVRTHRRRVGNRTREPKSEVFTFEDVNGFNGGFISGNSPCWILGDDKAQARFWNENEEKIYSWSTLKTDEGNEFLMTTEKVCDLRLCLMSKYDGLLLIGDIRSNITQLNTSPNRPALH
jgi:hypothetical protein